jgi:hypothetical protein
VRANRIKALVLLVTLISACPVGAEVTLTAEQRANLGIATEPFKAIEVSREWPAYGQVLDVSSLIGVLGDLRTAELTALASREEAARSELLYREDKNIARKALDAARIQANTDNAKVAMLKAQLLASWGSGIVSMPAAARMALNKDLLAGRASLVRADRLSASSDSQPIQQAHVATLDGQHEWSAQWLGPMSQSSGATLGGAFLLRVPAALPIGQPLTVSLLGMGSAVTSPSAPAAAVVRWRGAEWIYEETSANHFERLGVRTSSRAQGRALLAEGAKPRGPAVVVGARALLGAELGASDAQEESGAE